MKVFLWLLLTLVFLVLIFYVADSMFLPIQHAKGIITELSYNAAYSYPTVIRSGNSTIVTQTFVTEKFHLWIDVDGRLGYLDVNGWLYNHVHTKQIVDVSYVNGRFSNTIYIQNIEP